jgi:hypothetical protein
MSENRAVLFRGQHFQDEIIMLRFATLPFKALPSVPATAVGR